MSFVGFIDWETAKKIFLTVALTVIIFTIMISIGVAIMNAIEQPLVYACFNCTYHNMTGDYNCVGCTTDWAGLNEGLM